MVAVEVGYPLSLTPPERAWSAPYAPAAHAIAMATSTTNPASIRPRRRRAPLPGEGGGTGTSGAEGAVVVLIIHLPQRSLRPAPESCASLGRPRHEVAALLQRGLELC